MRAIEPLLINAEIKITYYLAKLKISNFRGGPRFNIREIIF